MSVVPNRSVSSCHTFIAWYSSATLQIAETTINVILFLRIYALYSQSKKIIYLLVPLLLIETGCTFYGGIEAGIALTKAMVALPFKLTLANCELYVRTFPSFKVTLAAWVPSLVIAAIFVGLSVYKVYEKAMIIGGYESRSSSRTTGQDLGIPILVQVIFRDGVVYYFVITLVTIMNAVLVLRPNSNTSTFTGIGLPIYLLFEYLCGCHLILNLYEIGKKQLLATQITGADIVFQSPRNVFMVQTDLSMSGTMVDSLAFVNEE